MGVTDQLHKNSLTKTCVPYQISLSNTNVVNYVMLAVHESNATFPVTRH